MSEILRPNFNQEPKSSSKKERVLTHREIVRLCIPKYWAMAEVLAQAGTINEDLVSGWEKILETSSDEAIALNLFSSNQFIWKHDLAYYRALARQVFKRGILNNPK